MKSRKKYYIPTSNYSHRLSLNPFNVKGKMILQRGFKNDEGDIAYFDADSLDYIDYCYDQFEKAMKEKYSEK